MAWFRDARLSRALLLGGLSLLLALVGGCRLPGAVRPTVKLGLAAPFEGRYRYVGYDVIYAVRLALREANAADGVGGYGVELTAYDDSADPDLAVETARQLAVDSALVAVSGHFRTETTAAALPVYAQAGLPLVAPVMWAAPPSGTSAVLFRLGPTGDELAAALLERAAADGRAFALVSDGGALGQAIAAEAVRRGTRPAVTVAPQEKGWSSAVLSSGAEAVVCATPPVAAGEVLSALRSSGWEGEFLGGPELAAPAFAALAGGDEGVAYVTPYPLPEEEFAAAYRQVSGGVSPGMFSVTAYESAQLLLTALERDIAARGRPSRAGMRAALAEVLAERPPATLTWR